MAVWIPFRLFFFFFFGGGGGEGRVGVCLARSQVTVLGPRHFYDGARLDLLIVLSSVAGR